MAAQAAATQTNAIVVDRSVIDDLITNVPSLCGKRGHSYQVCRSSGGNAYARAVEAEPAEPEEEREIQHVWALSVCDIPGIASDALSVCDNSDIPSGESGNLLNMIMGSGAEEHVVLLADWMSHCCGLLVCACAVPLLTMWECLAVVLCVDGVRTNFWS